MKHLKDILIIIILLAVVIGGVVILAAKFSKPINPPVELNTDSITKPYTDSIASLDKYIDSLEKLNNGQDGVLIRIDTVYEEFKENIPTYSDDSLDLLIFKEPDNNPLL